MKPDEVGKYLEGLTEKARKRQAEDDAATWKRRDLVIQEMGVVDELQHSGASRLEIARTTAKILTEKLGESGDLIFPTFTVVIESGKHEEFGEYDEVAQLTVFFDPRLDSAQSTSTDGSTINYFLGVGLVPKYTFNKDIDTFFKDDADQRSLKNAASAHYNLLPANARALISVQELKFTDTEVSDEFLFWVDKMLAAEGDRVESALSTRTSTS